MRIAILQTAGTSGAVEPNLEQLTGVADEAVGRGARLLVCPEMFLTGYNLEPAALAKLAEPANGSSAARVSDIARRSGLSVLYGYPERDGDAIYNSAALVDADGQVLANYRKCHMYGELDRRLFTPGNTPSAFADLDGVRVGVLICYDAEFPEALRYVALGGAAIALVPTASMKPFEFVARALIPVRAWENQIFVVYANRCGTEAELDYYGLSLVAGPDGGIVAQAGASEELLLAEIDLDARERAQREFNYLEDRRPELYR